jgi:hypothetical protein
MKKTLLIGTVAGLAMGVALLLTGGIAAFLVYGTRMAPEGKFEPSQMNVVYFFWTKLLIGWFFGLVFTFIYAKIRSALPARGGLRGFFYAAVLWLVISLWALSHPLVYEGAAAIATRDRLFWHIYTLGGFLGYGAMLGWLSRKEKGGHLAFGNAHYGKNGDGG